jgi:uncharacterized phage-associated protein
MAVQKLKLDSRKAIEASAILAQSLPGHRISNKRLLALLYIANRECLKKSARPLIGGKVVAMQHGPVHADLYDLTKAKEGAEGVAEWSQHFHSEGYSVVLDKDPGVNALSRFEVRILNQTIEKYEEVDDFDVARVTHNFSEYGTTYKKKGKKRTISLEKIVHAVSPPAMVTSILRDLRQKQEIDELFESAKEASDKNEH